MTVAVIDGDAWVYRCGGAAEKTYYIVVIEGNAQWPYGHVEKVDDYRAGMKYVKEHGGVLYNRKEIEPLENCLQMVKSSLENTLNVLGTKEYRIYLGGKRNFRDDLYGDYKANRDSAPKPKYYRDIRDYMVREWGARICDGIEADDAVAIDATSLGPDKAIIVGVDKDLDQVPGRHYNWVEGKSYSVSPREGLTFFYEQMLSGDTTDNIPGIPGIGEVKARKALVDCAKPQDAASRVWKLYYDNRELLGFSDDDEQRKFLDRNAHLLWIKRRADDSHPFWKHYEG
jgi:hypothetical protein